jgi:hypothetical protein
MSTKPITPLKKTSEASIINAVQGLLTLITLGFYAPGVYKKSIINLNMMAKLALDDKAEEVKFSAKFMYIALVAFWVPLALFFFNDSFIRPFAVPFTCSIPTNVAMPLLCICIISGLSLMWYILKIMSDVKDQMLKIAISYGRTDVIRLYLKDVGFLNLKREKLNQQAFNMLVDNHNKNVTRIP